LSTQLRAVVSSFNNKTAFDFINFFLCLGDTIDGVTLPLRNRVNADSEAKTPAS
jgi:hypothetical protein